MVDLNDSLVRLAEETMEEPSAAIQVMPPVAVDSNEGKT